MRKHKPISKETYGQIYKMLDAVSPLDCDCGALCGAACCTGGDGDMGIYLLPGEEEYLKDSGDWLKWSEGNAEDYAVHGRARSISCSAKRLRTARANGVPYSAVLIRCCRI